MNKILDVVLAAVRSGGKAAKSVAPSSGIIPKDGWANFVTDGDFASEKAILDIIRTNFPEDTILSEEIESKFSNDELLKLDHLWIIDPIDGTNNYRYNRHYSCISLGYAEKGILKVGAVYDFNYDELFYAQQGKGSFLNNHPICIGTKKDLRKATIATDNSYDPEETKRNLDILLKIEPLPFVLMKGCSALMMCEVASGRTDLYFHTVLKPWDIAAGFLIVEEAGGVVKGLRGEDINFLSPSFVLGNKRLVKQFTEKINK